MLPRDAGTQQGQKNIQNEVRAGGDVAGEAARAVAVVAASGSAGVRCDSFVARADGRAVAPLSCLPVLPGDVEGGLLADLHLDDALVPAWQRGVSAGPWNAEEGTAAPWTVPFGRTLDDLADADGRDKVAAADGAVEPVKEKARSAISSPCRDTAPGVWGPRGSAGPRTACPCCWAWRCP